MDDYHLCRKKISYSNSVHQNLRCVAHLCAFVSVAGRVGLHLVGALSVRGADFYCLKRRMELDQVISMNRTGIILKGSSPRQKK